MKFEKKYPTWTTDDPPNDDLMVLCEDSAPCAICKDETRWVDISFETTVCSEECSEQINRQWRAAMWQAEKKERLEKIVDEFKTKMLAKVEERARELRETLENELMSDETAQLLAENSFLEELKNL
jgi:hypothetical protein